MGQRTPIANSPWGPTHGGRPSAARPKSASSHLGKPHDVGARTPREPQSPPAPAGVRGGQLHRVQRAGATREHGVHGRATPRQLHHFFRATTEHGGVRAPPGTRKPEGARQEMSGARCTPPQLTRRARAHPSTLPTSLATTVNTFASVCPAPLRLHVNALVRLARLHATGTRPGSLAVHLPHRTYHARPRRIPPLLLHFQHAPARPLAEGDTPPVARGGVLHGERLRGNCGIGKRRTNKTAM